jgi:hypothetical protein
VAFLQRASLWISSIQFAKVFCFFFSKKKAFLSLSDWPCAGIKSKKHKQALLF